MNDLRGIKPEENSKFFEEVITYYVTNYCNFNLINLYRKINKLSKKNPCKKMNNSNSN